MTNQIEENSLMNTPDTSGGTNQEHIGNNQGSRALLALFSLGISSKKQEKGLIPKGVNSIWENMICTSVEWDDSPMKWNGGSRLEPMPGPYYKSFLSSSGKVDRKRVKTAVSFLTEVLPVSWSKFLFSDQNINGLGTYRLEETGKTVSWFIPWDAVQSGASHDSDMTLLAENLRNKLDPNKSIFGSQDAMQMVNDILSGMVEEESIRKHLLLYHAVVDGMKSERLFKEGAHLWEEAYQKNRVSEEGYGTVLTHIRATLEKYPKLESSLRDSLVSIGLDLKHRSSELEKWSKGVIEKSWESALATLYTGDILRESKFGSTLPERFYNIARVFSFVAPYLPEAVKSQILNYCRDLYTLTKDGRIDEQVFRQAEILLSRYIDREYALALLDTKDPTSRQALHEKWLREWGHALPQDTRNILREDLEKAVSDKDPRGTEAEFLLLLTFAKRKTKKG